MVKIYGNDVSIYSNGVKLAANAIGLEYEFQTMNFREGDLSKPEYLAIHPAGKVPSMTDDGFSLFESSTIMKYLSSKNGSNLYPGELKERMLVDQWLAFSTIHVGNAVGRVLFNKVFAPVIEAPVDEQSMADGIKFYERFLTVIDAQLGKNKYLVNDSLSLADIALLAVLDPSEVAGLDITPYSNVSKWRNALKQEKFYIDSFTSYEDVLKAMMSGANS